MIDDANFNLLSEGAQKDFDKNWEPKKQEIEDFYSKKEYVHKDPKVNEEARKKDAVEKQRRLENESKQLRQEIYDYHFQQFGTYDEVIKQREEQQHDSTQEIPNDQQQQQVAEEERQQSAEQRINELRERFRTEHNRVSTKHEFNKERGKEL